MFSSDNEEFWRAQCAAELSARIEAEAERDRLRQELLNVLAMVLWGESGSGELHTRLERVRRHDPPGGKVRCDDWR